MSGSYSISENFRRYSYINGNVLIENSGIKVIKEPLRLGDDPIKYESPNVIEIKITNKCMHSCIWCHENSSEGGDNKILPDLYTKLSELPDYGYIFILSGGCILENLHGFMDIYNFLISAFSTVTICVELSSIDLYRMNSLPKTFGKHLSNAFLEYPGFYCISINSVKDLDQLNSIIKTTTDRFYWSIMLLKFDHTVFKFSLIKEFLKSEDRIKVVVEGGNGKLDQKNEILSFIKEQRLCYRKPQILFDPDAYKQLELSKLLLPSEESIYSLGWDNGYIYVDAVNGTYRKSRLGENTSWNNLSILDYYGR